MQKIGSKLLNAWPALAPLLSAVLASACLLMLAACASQAPQPLTVRHVEIVSRVPPQSLLAPNCPAEPAAPALNGKDWDAELIDWASALLNRGNCLDGALVALRKWSAEQ